MRIGQFSLLILFCLCNFSCRRHATQKVIAPSTAPAASAPSVQPVATSPIGPRAPSDPGCGCEAVREREQQVQSSASVSPNVLFHVTIASLEHRMEFSMLRDSTCDSVRNYCFTCSLIVESWQASFVDARLLCELFPRHAPPITWRDGTADGLPASVDLFVSAVLVPLFQELNHERICYESRIWNATAVPDPSIDHAQHI